MTTFTSSPLSMPSSLLPSSSAASSPLDAYLVPTQETGAHDFVQDVMINKNKNKNKNNKSNNNGDCKNVLVGILDTGIDPALFAHHNNTPQQQQQLVDVWDCTGAGDVDVSYETCAKLVEVSVNEKDDDNKNDDSSSSSSSSRRRQVYQVTGLSGRTLWLNTSWKFCDFPDKLNNKSNNNEAQQQKATSNGNSSKKNNKNGDALSNASHHSTTSTTSQSPSQSTSNTSKDPPAQQQTSAALRAAHGQLPTTVPVRLGMKRAYDIFYPRALQTRVQQARQESWHNALRPYLKQARQDLNTANGKLATDHKTTAETKAWQQEYQARLDLLQETTTTSSSNNNNSWLPDPGPVIDCVVFYDGEEYRAVVVTQSCTSTTTSNDGTNNNANDAAETASAVNGTQTTEEKSSNTPQKNNGNNYKETSNNNNDERSNSHRIKTSTILDCTQYQPLARFGLEHQYTTLSSLDQCNVAVQFPDTTNDGGGGGGGRILQLVTDASPHGTHVASITAGVAPGVKLLSLKIGDARLAGMETGTALTRALAAAIRYKCDVINLSYGEGCAMANTGRFVELATQLVYDYGITFVSSAGNNGPALTTVGAPGGTTSALLGVAAHVSPQMFKVLYSRIQEQHAETSQTTQVEDDDDESVAASTAAAADEYGTTYTWSSVGPTADGDMGVDICAPGGAITSVSKWCLQSKRLMNGTSMSSPHAAGCVALLLSAAKTHKLPAAARSPILIKRAIQNTARKLPNLSPLQQGAGMINVPAAWEYLQAHAKSADDVTYAVTVDNNGDARGIYLRQYDETRTAHTWNITVNPIWPKSYDISQAAQTMRTNLETHFELRVAVTSSPSPDDGNKDSDWIRIPQHLVVLNGGRSFKMDIDPTLLPPGLHTATVQGFSLQSDADAGPLFTVPITVAKPLPTTTTFDSGNLKLEPAETKRFFLVPPLGSTWMDVVLQDKRPVVDSAEDGASSSTKLYALHTVQLLPHAAYRDYEVAKYYNLRPGQTTVATIAIEAGVTIETVLGRYWSTLGDASLQCKVQFRGIRPTPNHVQIFCGDAGACVRVVSDLQPEALLPAAKLTQWRTPLRPKENPMLQPLSEKRDIFPTGGAGPDKEIYELQLVYEFTQEEKGAFTPRVPTTQGVLYESGFESQLILVFDGEKKLLGTADSWPSSIPAPKGKVVLRMQVRHDNPEKLETLKDMPLWIERNLDKEIALSVYSSREAMVLGKPTFRKRILRKGSTAAVFFQEPQISKMPSGCKPGDSLIGSFSLASGDALLLGEGKRPGGFPITYTVGPKPTKPSESDPPVTKDERTPREKLDEAIRDLKVTRLEELTQMEKDEGKFEELFEEFVKEYPKHLPLLMAKLRYLDTHSQRKDKLSVIVSSADAVLNEISEDALAMYFGRKSDQDDPEANKLKKEMKQTKTFFIEALARSAMAYSDLQTEDSKTKFDDVMSRLKAWVEIESEKQYLQLYLDCEKRAGRFGMVVKTINKTLSKEIKEKDFLYPVSKARLMEERATALDKLGYKELVDQDQLVRAVSWPRAYELF